MKVEETSFLNEYIAMADYGDRLGWHERNGGEFHLLDEAGKCCGCKR